MSVNNVTTKNSRHERKLGVNRSGRTQTKKTSSSLAGSARSSNKSNKSSVASSTSEKESHAKYILTTRSKSSKPFPVINIKQTRSISQTHSVASSSDDTSKQLSVSKAHQEIPCIQKKMSKIAIFIGFLIISTLIVTFALINVQQTRMNEKESLFGLAQTEFFGSSLSFTSDGEMLAVGGHKVVRVYSNIGDEKNKVWVPIIDLSSFMSGDYFSSYSKVVLSSNGLHLIVGDPDSNKNGDNSGSVFVFQKVDVNWRNIGLIHGSTPYSQFGHSVDISDDGTRIISTSGVGSVYFYELENEQWQQQKIFENVGNVASISGDGKRMAVGNGKANLGAGQVAVYDLDTLSLIASKDSNVDLIRLGNSIAFSKDGSTVAVGMAYDLIIDLSLGRTQSSFVSVYRLDSQNRDLIEYGKKIIGPNYSQFGRSISLSDDGKVIAIGAPRFDSRKENVGRTSIYVMENGKWTRVRRVTGSTNSEEFGSSVALSGNGKMLGIGSPKNNAFGSYTGRVRALNI